MNPTRPHTSRRSGGRQAGVAAVEFGLVSIYFFLVLLGIIEFGRFMYVFNTVQEVTRRAAREATVRWVDQADEAKRLALFGGTSLPAGGEIKTSNIEITYLTADQKAPDPFPPGATENVSACLSPTGGGCIALVRVTISGATYAPMMGLFSFLGKIPVPPSTVVMPAESLGYSPS